VKSWAVTVIDALLSILLGALEGLTDFLRHARSNTIPASIFQFEHRRDRPQSGISGDYEISSLEPGHTECFMKSMAISVIKSRPVVLFRLAVLSLALGAACSCQAASSRLSNISTRGVVQINNDVLIGGFIIGGTGAKQLLLRALGPTLTQFGVPGALLDPTLELRNSSGGLVVSNDDWGTAANAQSIPANLRPPNAHESAILATLSPGSYTAIVRGVNNTTGVALVEAYDLDTSSTSRLTNISTRGLVQTDSNVMIAGVIVQTSSEKVIVRALGPTLASFGITNPLADPTLELHDANGNLLAANDNWKTTQQTEITASGYAPPNDLESAIVSTLAPGNYTAIVRGVNSTTGVALVEVYALQTPEVWIAIRTDGLPGSGTKANPYDGSTPEKFDALMSNFQGISSLGIHLVGSGPFRTYVTHSWWLQSGWVISGDGMDSTTVQMAGNAAGLRIDVVALKSNPGYATDNVTIRDLTVDCNWAELSKTADDGAGGEKNIKTGAIIIWGSNNLIDRVRCINSYGSLANHLERFSIALGGPRSHDGTNNVIQYCRVELPAGNYGMPFLICGLPPYVIANSKVTGCYAVGNAGGLSWSDPTMGYNSGGVGVAYVKDCQIDGNTFIDCAGAAYTDTGSIDGLQITNNTVIRGVYAVGFIFQASPKQNILISGNSFLIQNRCQVGASYGIVMGWEQTTNLTVTNNVITFDSSGPGELSFWGMQLSSLTNATISNNIIGFANCPVNNSVTGDNVTLSNNLDPNGNPVPGL
jgi:hypothetical protein